MNTLTPLLGVDKSNPLLELLVNPDFPDEILVHYGMHLLEKVHRGTDSIEEKLLSGRLYNAGIKRSELVRIFNRDRKTIRGYAEALKSGDAERLKSALSGQGSPRKICASEDRFIRQTFREVHEQKGCHSNAFIRKELLEKLGIEVCYETVRKILKDEKSNLKNHPLVKTRSNCDTPRALVSGDVVSTEGPKESSQKENRGKNIRVLSSNQDEKHNHSPAFPIPAKGNEETNKGQFFFHGGLFLILESILQITKALTEIREQARQWLGNILCGAVNIEQSAGLHFDSLSRIFQQKILSDEAQRQILHEYSLTNGITELRQANMIFIGAHLQDTFLYDPHGIEYTGSAHILKGWLGSKHKIAKAYYQDFIHTLDGKPAVGFLDDNREDLRRRFPGNIKQFRKLLAGDQKRPLTFIVDRAIYDLEDLQTYWKDRIYVITWEKGCGKIKWNPQEKDVGAFSFMRYRNHGNDTRTYRVKYYSEPWKRDIRFKRHLTQIYKGDLPCQSVLSIICTDNTRCAEAAVEPILRRWVQENDILYLINEFGINQITSYAKVNYADIADKIEDYQFSHPSTRKICAKKMTLRQKLGVKIVKYEDRQRQLKLDQGQYKTIKEKLKALPQEDKNLKKEGQRLATSIKGKVKRLEEAAQKLDQLKKEYRQEIACLETQLKEVPETLSRLEFLIEEKYQTLKFGPKTLMDAVRIAARNIFGQCHDQFRPLYENYRNDHRILRELIRAPALVSWQKNQQQVILISTRNYQKKQRQSIEKLLKQINDQIAIGKEKPNQKFSLYEDGSGISICYF